MPAKKSQIPLNKLSVGDSWKCLVFGIVWLRIVDARSFCLISKNVKRSQEPLNGIVVILPYSHRATAIC